VHFTIIAGSAWPAATCHKNSISSLLKSLNEISDIELRNISIAEPDLEEIFMNYYAKED